MKRVLIVGGYGNAGKCIVEMLLDASDAALVVAGRNEMRGRQFIEEKNVAPDRLTFLALDATDPESMFKAADGVDLVVMASGTSMFAEATVRSTLQASTDYIDLQVNAGKTRVLQEIDPLAKSQGRCVITDAGFHPGLPAAMVRYLISRVPTLTTARISSLIAIDWHQSMPISASTVEEFVDEFRDFAYEEYADGHWRAAGKPRRVVFPSPFGRRLCTAMGLAEMHEITSSYPQLTDAGFWVAGFNPVTDFLAIPLAFVGMRYFPKHLKRPLSRLLQGSLLHFSRPPYGVVLQLDGKAGVSAEGPLMRISHPDAYVVTAAPVVATILQLLDGSISTPGVHLQATIVDIERFFVDLARLGLRIEVFI
ncbi:MULTISPECIES: saccharopine dehydrogenase NADP-binding domain-containing protein [unclassified Raoultella]|uniref:saccharopine dehydrogenase NADP-binding domain-containing protein n=1 Tax=unclassified Raoultella TaxID=2627600 RepID=UPI0013593EA4|nr:MULTISPECIES: saccharopine dehydrogenase NADP-binding domain-containing protein [unclassified Raoultella]